MSPIFCATPHRSILDGWGTVVVPATHSIGFSDGSTQYFCHAHADEVLAHNGYGVSGWYAHVKFYELINPKGIK